MIVSHSFYDLCIQESFFRSENIDERLQLLYNYGYRTLAVNQFIDDGSVEPKKKKKKGGTRETVEVVPSPFNLDTMKEIVVKQRLHNLRLLNRLTVEFSNPEVLHKITKSPNFKKYDLVASSPTSTQALSFTCATFEADIFTFNPENKFGLRINRKMYNQLIERGYHFELLYTPAIIDSTKRKNLIHTAHLYHSFGKSRNIFFSSGADDPAYIRNPYDVINLGFMFGFGTLQCKASVSHHPRKVILNSVGRRHGKAVMFVDNIEPEEKNVDALLSQEVKVDDENGDMDIDQPKLKKTKL